jgi:hypothetical protein
MTLEPLPEVQPLWNAGCEAEDTTSAWATPAEIRSEATTRWRIDMKVTPRKVKIILFASTKPS